MSHVVRGSWSHGLARGLWGGTGAWLGVILCLIALLYQSFHIGNLQKELYQIQRSKEEPRAQVREHQHAEESSLQMCPRGRRELPRRHKGSELYCSGLKSLAKESSSLARRKRCFLHLVPEAFSSDGLQDLTEISWKVSLEVGNSIDVQETVVKVKDSGIYFIYSQVLYKDTTFTMGQLVTRVAGSDSGQGEVLLRCVQSMPDNQTLAYNTCYSAGVFMLQKGDVIQLTIPRFNAIFDARGPATFMGLVKL
ncbi:tumor necrosis factor ligand superfamily member 13 isoform 1-T2 [Discoglossus pictus]